jgi:hypothetical protein
MCFRGVFLGSFVSISESLTDLPQKTKAQLSNVVEKMGKETLAADVHPDDTQDLQVLQDRSVQLCQFLGMNRHVLNEIRHNQIHFRVDSGQSIDESFLLSLIADSDEQIRRTETVLRRLDDTLGLVRKRGCSGRDQF